MVRGKKRVIDRKSLDKVTTTAALNPSIHNRFDIEVIDSVTGEVKQTAYAENMILNQMWTRLLGAWSENRYLWTKYLHYGSGTGVQAATRTSLFTFVGYKATTNPIVVHDFENGVSSAKRSVQLSESDAIGVTITEVGAAWGTASSNLSTHAMLKDMNGNPISIVKTSTDIINIYITVFVHYSDFYNGHVKMSAGVLLDFCMGESIYGFTSSYYNYLYEGGGFGNGSTAEYVSQVTTFTPGEKKITLALSRLVVGKANFTGGIGSIIMRDGPCLFTGMDGWYSGSTIQGEAIGTGDGTTKDFVTDFKIASGATVYVNGVAESNITVDPYPTLHRTNMGVEFDCIDSTGKLCRNPMKPLPVNQGLSVGEHFWYNPYWEIGIVGFSTYDSSSLYGSDDLVNWVLVNTTVPNHTINVAHQHFKYWKGVSVSSSSKIYNIIANFPATNIHFITAPASGAVITADYTTDVIAKDTNHVFDLTVTITLGEKIV